MSDLISALSTHTGLDPDLAQKGLGAVLDFLKERLPAELYAKVEAALPRAGDAISSFLAGKQAPGLLEKAGGMLGGAIGGKASDLSQVVERLSASGMSVDQAKTFLPKLGEHLKGLLPDEVLDQIAARVPGLGEALQQSDA